MNSVAIAAAVSIAIVAVVAALAITQYLGGLSAVRVRFKLWSWRRRLDVVDDRILAIAGEYQEKTVEEAYQELDREYPGTLEAKREQLLAERDYLQARIEALERDRDSA